MLFIHTQLSSFAKQAVFICSIVATLLWCSGLCVPLLAETFIQAYFELSEYWNITIFSVCLLGQTGTPLLISAYGPEMWSVICKLGKFTNMLSTYVHPVIHNGTIFRLNYLQNMLSKPDHVGQQTSTKWV